MTTNNVRSGVVVGTGVAINVELGWVPCSVDLYNASDGTLVTKAFLMPYVMGFTGGGTAEITAGAHIRGVTSHATAEVASVTLSSGSWGGGDAAGFLVLIEGSVVGTFTAGGENLVITNLPSQVTGTDDATLPSGGSVGSHSFAISSAIASASGTSAISRYEGSATTGRGFTIGSTLAVAAKELRWRAMRDQVFITPDWPALSYTPSGVASSFPDATNTGTTSAGKPTYAGPYTLNSPTTIDGYVLNNTITINVGGAGSVIRNCYSDLSLLSPLYGVDVSGIVNNVTIEDCTFIGPGLVYASNAAISLGGATNAIVRRNNCSAYENGILIGISGDCSDNYIHDLRGGAASPHEDGITCLGGQTSGTITHNTVIGRDTSCIFLKDTFGSVANITIDNNYLSGTVGAGPFFPINTTDTGTGITGLVVINNHIKILADTAGPWSFAGFTPSLLHGNVDADTLVLFPGQT